MADEWGTLAASPTLRQCRLFRQLQQPRASTWTANHRVKQSLRNAHDSRAFRLFGCYLFVGALAQAQRRLQYVRLRLLTGAFHALRPLAP